MQSTHIAYILFHNLWEWLLLCLWDYKRMSSFFCIYELKNPRIDELQGQQLCALIKLYQHFVI